MKIRYAIIQQIGNRKSPLAYGLINYILKARYFKAFYNCLQMQEINWNGKHACFSLSFDCDYKEDVYAVPELLDILARYSMEASFACIGKWIEQYPGIHKKIIEEGHEIVNHTYTHPPHEELNPNIKFNKLTLEQQSEEIKKCHDVCKNVLDYEPVGFRIPHCGGQYTDTIYGILKELGYSYSSSLKAIRSPDLGLPFYTKEHILELPLTTCPQHPINAFDTWHAFHEGKHSENEFYELFREIIAVGIDCGAYMNVYLDPRDVVSTAVFEQVLALLQDKQDKLHIAKYEDLRGIVKDRNDAEQ